MTFTTLAISEEFVSTLEVLEDGTIDFDDLPVLTDEITVMSHRDVIELFPIRQDDGNDYWADRN